VVEVNVVDFEVGIDVIEAGIVGFTAGVGNSVFIGFQALSKLHLTGFQSRIQVRVFQFTVSQVKLLQYLLDTKSFNLLISHLT
jgi:hypothetical protein